MFSHQRFTFLVASVVGAVFALPSATYAFGGEDLLQGNPWHHEDMSEKAAIARGFRTNAAKDIAWHADYIDSYLYNPIWWAKGGVQRFKVALSSEPELVKLHCDDLFSQESIDLAKRRYLAGTLIGLKWAAEKGDVGAARNLIGISLHAIQDFYSHSNWIDASNRRQQTWFQVPETQRSRLTLFSGAYEKPTRFGIKHHGKYAPACSILNSGSTFSISRLLTAACSGFSPLSNSAICQQWKSCRNAQPISGGQLTGVGIPNNVVYINPPGMALDNTWLAKIGAKERGLDLTGEQAFTTAKGLAQQASIQWLEILETSMNRLGQSSFWQRVKTEQLRTSREAEYEQYNKFPYQFLSAGPYPNTRGDTGNGYYLRVRLKTSRSRGAGTDADLRLIAGGRSFLLDYMPRANPVIAYNDFEAGDDAVYTVGPFSRMPSRITIQNRSADGRAVLRSLGQSFVRGIESTISGAKTFLLSLIGGNADVIGSTRMIWQANDLQRIGTSTQSFSKRINGGDEGVYDIRGTIRKVREASTASIDPMDNWAEYEVRLTSLKCIKESKWDRGSNSDEPFLLALLVSLPGNVQSYRTGAFSDVDKGETRQINQTFARVRVPQDYGAISLPMSLLESDDEGSSGRDRALREFASQGSKKTEQARKGFTDTLGTAIAADWKLASIDVYAFYRAIA